MKRAILLLTVAMLLFIGCNCASATPIKVCILIDGNSQMSHPLDIENTPDSLLSGTDVINGQPFEWSVQTWSPPDVTEYWSHSDEYWPGYHTTTWEFLAGWTDDYDRRIVYAGCGYDINEYFETIFPYASSGVYWDWPTYQANIQNIRHGFANIFYRQGDVAEEGEFIEESSKRTSPDPRWIGDWERRTQPRSTVPVQRTYKMQDGDILRIFCGGTGLALDYGGVEIKACALSQPGAASNDTVTHPNPCEDWGGDALLASYTGSNQHFLGLRQLIMPIIPEDPEAEYLIEIVTSFAFAAAFEADLAGIPGVNIISGVGANEVVRICDDDAWIENQINMCLGGEHRYSPPGNTPISEGAVWPAIMYIRQNTAGDLFCEEFDIDGDGFQVNLEDAVYMMNDLNSQNTCSGVFSQNRVLTQVCPEWTPCSQVAAPPPEDKPWGVYPNPGNPILTLKFSVPYQFQKVDIYNIMGQRVLRIENPVNEVEFGSGLATGMYIIQAQRWNGSYTDGKKCMILK